MGATEADFNLERVVHTIYRTSSEALLRRIDIYVEWLCDRAQSHVKKYARRNWITFAIVRNWTIEELSLRVITCLSRHSPNHCLILKAIILLWNCDRDRCIPDVILAVGGDGSGIVGGDGAEGRLG